MLTVDPRAGRGGRGGAAADPPELLRALVARGEDAVARTPRACSTCCARRASSTPAAPGSSRSSAASPPSLTRRAAARARRPARGGARHRRDPPGALAVPLLHGRSSSRATSSTRDALEARARAARRLAARRRRPRPRSRCTSTPTTPGAALSLGVARGRDRRASRSRTCTSRPQQREERLLARACPAAAPRRGVVAVVAGDGQPRASSRASARAVVEGGQTMNPSTADLARRDRGDAAPTRSSAAEQLERRSWPPSRPPRTPASRSRSCRRDSIPAGLAALVAFDGARGADENAAAMREALAARRDRRGHDRLARRRAERRRRCARATWLGARRRRAGRRRRRASTRSRAPSLERLLAEPRERADAPHAARTRRRSNGLLDELAERASRARARRARGRPAALPAAPLGRVDSHR